ncbi:MAG: hypothetical protein RQ826_07040 [Xanthomonadales bacterium]|nr:hypothetical protein [Xanthomonadales bacterium]
MARATRRLNIDTDLVFVQSGFDAAWSTFVGHSGTCASQFAVTGMTVIHGAGEKLKAELRQLAALQHIVVEIVRDTCRPGGIAYSFGRRIVQRRTRD